MNNCLLQQEYDFVNIRMADFGGHGFKNTHVQCRAASETRKRGNEKQYCVCTLVKALTQLISNSMLQATESTILNKKGPSSRGQTETLKTWFTKTQMSLIDGAGRTDRTS